MNFSVHVERRLSCWTQLNWNFTRHKFYQVEGLLITFHFLNACCMRFPVIQCSQMAYFMRSHWNLEETNPVRKLLSFLSIICMIKFHIALVLAFVNRYIESGCYEGFYERSGKEMIQKNTKSCVMPYKIYTKEDFINSELKSTFDCSHEIPCITV